MRTHYGATSAASSTEGAVTKNPGTVVFDEELLHNAVESSAWRSQFWVLCTQLLMPLKLILLLLLLPLLLAVWLFAPFGVRNNAILWFIALAAVMPIGVLLVELVEDLLEQLNSKSVKAVVRILVEHPAELIVSLMALHHPPEEMALWVKPMLLGCIMTSMLLTVGVGLLLAVPSDTAYRLAASVWRNFRPLLLFFTVCFLLPTLHRETTRATAPVEKSHAAAVAVVLSRTLALLAIGVYLVALVTGFRSGNHMYASAGNANAPTSLSYVSQYFRSGREYKDACPVFEARYSVAFAVVSASATLAVFVAVCHIIVGTMSEASHVFSLPLPFIAVVVLPLAFHGGSVYGAARMASVGRLDIAACMGLSSTLRLYHGVVPIVVLVAWAVGRPVDLVLHPFLAGVCLLGIIAMSHLLAEGPVQQVDGAVLVAFYAIVACACFLGDGSGVWDTQSL